VGLAEHFRQRAVQCFAWAQSVLGLRERMTWLTMAQYWHRLAQQAEQNERRAPPFCNPAASASDCASQRPQAD